MCASVSESLGTPVQQHSRACPPLTFTCGVYVCKCVGVVLRGAWQCSNSWRACPQLTVICMCASVFQWYGVCQCSNSCRACPPLNTSNQIICSKCYAINCSLHSINCSRPCKEGITYMHIEGTKSKCTGNLIICSRPYAINCSRHSVNCCSFNIEGITHIYVEGIKYTCGGDQI